MNNNKPVRLLILEESQNRAEELIVLLRNSGRATRAQQIKSKTNLAKLLKNQTWDLLLGCDEANDVKMIDALNAIREQEKDIPIVMIALDRNPESITEGLRWGLQDVALQDDDERLVLIIERELANLEHRRQRRRAEVEVREIDRRNQLLLASSAAAIAYVHEGMHIYTNSSYAELFGYQEPGDFAGIPIIDLVASEDQNKFKIFLKSFNDNETVTGEFSCVCTDGSTVPSTMSLSPASYDGEPCTQVIINALVSQNDNEIADRIKKISSQDLLTGLYNRNFFMEQLDSAVDEATEGGKSRILFYINIDDFSRTRTNAGISSTDLILRDLAALIRTNTPDEHLVARFGDDVLTLIFDDSDKDEASCLAELLRNTVESHVSEISGKSYQQTISIGLSLISENAPSAEEIVSRAHRAQTGVTEGNGVNFYQAAQVQVGEDGQSLTSENIKHMVRTAIENNSFRLVFQPIISLHGDDDEQFEVLLRLLDQDGNEIFPGQFLGPAEDAGLLEKVDRWVILQSIKMLSEHRANGSKARLFINLTHRSMSDETFLPWMSVALRAARLTSDAIIFQIHENDATSYIKQATKFTKGAAELHCKTSINHFGCSLNPFNLLRHLTPDYVKLDGSFAQEIENDEEKKAELMHMVKSLQSAGVLTAISGVESPNVLQTLWMTGMNFIQGFYISPPLETMDYDFASEDL
ncbi:MAG: diguanylate cyclase (GGDEF)-like protein/PAS domain S-box-containing protein [Candidatus Azotimanducaceae bacterium]|jgi:diguanylate cyclase (GGDEF)-like protein/PAS domain S-box-containing protein